MSDSAELRTRIYQYLQLDETTTLPATLDGWIVRAVTNLAQLIKGEKRSWEVLSPFKKVHSGILTDECEVEKPDGFIELVNGDVMDRIIVKTISEDLLPMVKDAIKQPTYDELFLVTDCQTDGQDARAETKWIIWPTLYPKYPFRLTYIAVPTGNEEFSEQIAELLTYGASVIGAGILQDFNRLTIAEQKYRESLALLVRVK